ncbi:trigger factor [Uliginosibacterium sediminicola]|uniref:Trigger factor n=1 Tax=Uliginosibacterium sediminicola TaxID=2024550 RepID=A0ABU9Z0S2_9RHOO
MQTNEVTLGALERRIDMAVSQADIERDVGARLKNMARTVKMAGFRPGKVPLKIVEQTYGPQVRSEVLGDAVERSFGEKVREQNLRVAGYPRIEPKADSAEGQIEFSATFEVYPEVVVGDLSDNTVERPTLSIGDAEVDKTLDVLRKQRTTYEVAARASQELDRVVIDFTGRKDGEVFEGGQATDFPVVVGGGQMLPAFDAQLHGVSAGDSKTFDLTFPEDYHAQNLAGQTVQFEILVKQVEAAKLPELDAEFARSLGVADGDVDKMRAEIRNNLEREVKRRIRNAVRGNVFEVLDRVVQLDVPKALIESESARMAEEAKQDLARRGMDPKNVPVEPAWFVEQATRRVKISLIVSDIVAKNKLNATPDQVRRQVEELAQSYENPQELIKWYYANPERLSNIEDLAVEDNVVEWLSTQLKVVDKAVSFDELMNNQQTA